MAARYMADPSNECLVAITSELVEETNALIEKRCQTDQSMKAAILEQDDKWQAFARRCNPPLNPQGFRLVFQELHPSTAEFVWPKTT